jgi:hypothetical protein
MKHSRVVLSCSLLVSGVAAGQGASTPSDPAAAGSSHNPAPKPAAKGTSRAASKPALGPSTKTTNVDKSPMQKHQSAPATDPGVEHPNLPPPAK